MVAEFLGANKAKVRVYGLRVWDFRAPSMLVSMSSNTLS